jgi:DNA-directed RNA polymerase beta subunit
VKIINPIFKIQNPERNIFTLRQDDYKQILPTVREILKPAEDLGFAVTELDLKDSRFSTGELSKTIRQSLVIRLKKGSSEIDLSMFIPKLIEDNYVLINGRRKIPLFQMFDIPVVTRGTSIKLRTNVATIMLFKDKEPPYLKMSFLGRKAPFSLMLLGYFGMEEMAKRFDLKNASIPKPETLYEQMVADLVSYYEESKGYTQDDFILEIGRLYSKYNARSKGEDVMYALDIIPKIDVMTAKFLTQETILDELIEAARTQYIDDTLLTNKRVRCFEYMVLSKVAKNVFDLCFSNRTARQPKFNINSTQIINESNVSDIVQFDFSINPIEELTKLSRVSLLGPGGFKRENIPKHLRDICPTMFGRICPVDTPDRDNCGVLQNMIPNVSIDENLKFTNEICDEQPISIPVSMTPFCEHDDPTRLQMASSQMRQAILLKKLEQPYIQSGCEWLYTDYTQFVKRAKKDGEVIHLDQEYLIVQYDDGEVDIFIIAYRKIYVEHMDFMNIYVRTGDQFKAGDILAESNFCKDGKINIGRNLLTAVMSYYGDNYEDGIVVSDRLVKDQILTSVHFMDLSFTLPPSKVLMSIDENTYKPLPDLFEKIQKGAPYAIIKSMNYEDFYSVFNEENRLEAKKFMIISDVNIYANEWNTDVPEFDDWVQKKIEAQKERETYLCKIIKDKLPKNEANRFIRENDLDKFSFVGKYKFKKERINGIEIEMFGVHFRPVQVGDKMANRHGNKGVISRILPQDKMPQLPDGRHVDICINPLGIISRMNTGQLFELHLTLSLEDLKKQALTMLDNQKDLKKYILDYIKIIDKTKSGWYLKQFKENLPETIDEEFINNLTLIQPPFNSIKEHDLTQALAYTKTRYKQQIYDPVAKQHLLNRIATGYIYFFRMVHIAEEKLAARGIGAYARRTLQPLGGRKNKGGQRCGEMETACLIGHDAPCNLFEFLTTKSDCIDMKNRYIRDVISPNLPEESHDLDTTPESVKLLNAYLTVIGADHR